MNGVDRAVAATKALTARRVRRTVACGVVRVRPADGLATVAGIAVEPVPVGRSQWTDTFVEQVNAGTADGQRVLVLFIDGQTWILGTTGGA